MKQVNRYLHVVSLVAACTTAKLAGAAAASQIVAQSNLRHTKSDLPTRFTAHFFQHTEAPPYKIAFFRRFNRAPTPSQCTRTIAASQLPQLAGQAIEAEEGTHCAAPFRQLQTLAFATQSTASVLLAPFRWEASDLAPLSPAYNCIWELVSDNRPLPNLLGNPIHITPPPSTSALKKSRF